jgi:hypothetical protein
MSEHPSLKPKPVPQVPEITLEETFAKIEHNKQTLLTLKEALPVLNAELDAFDALALEVLELLKKRLEKQK